MRETTVRRVEWYLGPDSEIQAEDLDKYEDEGGWVLEPKVDGMWSMLEVNNKSGHFMKSRDARTPEIGSVADELREIKLVVPEKTIFAGEFEGATQWATQTSEASGFKRDHLFDVPRIGDDDIRSWPWFRRRPKLEELYASMMKGHDDRVKTRFLLVPYYEKDFRRVYDETIRDGFEGVVLKRKDSTYQTSRSDGKTDEWLRCKRWLTGDYVLYDIGWTDGGMYGEPRPTGQWGLFKKGQLVKVMQANCPKELLTSENIGCLVAEFKGWAKFKSGALRHATFVRTRVDKSPEDCV